MPNHCSENRLEFCCENLQKDLDFILKGTDRESFALRPLVAATGISDQLPF